MTPCSIRCFSILLFSFSALRDLFLARRSHDLGSPSSVFISTATPNPAVEETLRLYAEFVPSLR